MHKINSILRRILFVILSTFMLVSPLQDSSVKAQISDVEEVVENGGETSISQDVTAMPEITTTPETTVNPEIADEALTTADHVATESPLITDEPLITAEPMLTEEPVMTEELAVNEDVQEHFEVKGEGLDNRPKPDSQENIIVKNQRSINQVFESVTTNGTVVKYRVLTEDANSNSGTVEIGNGNKTGADGYTSNANGLTANYATDNTLVIPETVSNNGITYTVVGIGKHGLDDAKLEHITFPSTMKTIGDLDNNKFVSIEIPEGVERVGDMAFSGMTTLKMVKFPTTIKSMGSGIFQESTNVTTVYFPVSNDVAFIKDDSTKTNVPFAGLNLNKAVIVTANESQYNKWVKNYTLFHHNNQESARTMLTYEIEAEFYDKDLNKLNLAPVKKLYGASIAKTKNLQTGEWTEVKYNQCDDLPALPTDLEYKANYWAVNEIGIATVDGKGVVAEIHLDNIQGFNGYFNFIDGKLVAVEEPLKLSVTGVNKTYDSKSEGIVFGLNRKLASDYFAKDSSGIGVRYTTIWVDPPGGYGSGYKFYNFPVELGHTVSASTANAGFENVADSGTYSWLWVMYDKQHGYNGNRYYTLTSPPGVNTVKVQINPATIAINPYVVSTEITWENQTELPTIKLGTEDTKGTIEWDVGQSPQEGTHSYTYTFVPDNLYASGVGGSDIANFTETEKKGSIEITYKEAIIPTPTPVPVPKPTITPTPTIRPTIKPTVEPSIKPSATPSVEPTISPEPSKPGAKTDHIENTEDGVKVETVNKDKVFEADSEVIVVNSTSAKKEEVSKDLDEVVGVIDIYIKENGVIVDKEISGKIKVYLDAKDYQNYSDLKVWQKNKSESYQELEYEIEEGMIVFECDALDTYVLTGVKANEGMIDCLWWLVIAIILAIGGALYYIFKRRFSIKISKS